jgi:cytochrome c biogenesis protein CcmG/thiol:disulfide interchange protein DsbE
VKRIVIAVVIAAVAIIVIVAYAQAKEDGGQARTLAGTTLAGQSFDLVSTRGKPTVINFFASWCPPCNSEAPDLVAFSKAHPEASFVGVAVNDERADTEGFVSKYGIAYPVVYDPEGGLGNDWGVTGIPTTFFLDADGVVKDTIIGAASREQFEASLEKAL